MDEYEQQLIAALVSEPQSIREKLSPADREQLDVLLDLVAEGGGEQRARGIARAVAAHLRAALPDDEGTAVGRRYTSSSLTRRPPHDVLLERFAPGGPGGPGTPGVAGAPSGEARTPGSAAGPAATPGGPPRTEARWASARDRLLAEPALTDTELTEIFGVAPEQPELIRLRAAQGPEVLPAFQFDGEGRPRSLVLAINAMLGAAADPWGVADWWLGPNLWLDAVPATLLGAGLDEQLLAAASVVGEDD
ncbi:MULTISPECIES: DUF3168 domain-containing protein [Streptomyces]|uniref:DUF3168 domain-containing protein n=1 Tax=Streptomyces TaxID=1883 RepID=UPI000BC37366|nr:MULTISPECIES: DUF3168 domain-containing protein [Streptomyces]MDX2553125.1 DUF3168 domain-containing protein [Streptomyces stelliscabiei]MDX2612113.1 DUF3168 domain-containing protein [Streptomyces stelliscabiei]MDX2636451.1 DUF3168 domain-containing protein [Streptomyces stelliscabiei]MDX2663202.1 DUF3168 domain-containing protein [Streptomyces stelliscabiei]MDX2714297.1 DUF3168 domain-containing protein [Streptomyces stelliscabiei]